MSATGIGASVRRKEDQRFITGKGHYTDDINRPGQAAIYFIRSPHAHAKIKKIDTAAAAKMPGVAGVFTGEQFAQDKLGNLICGWTVLSKDGSPMKMAPHAALAAGKANHVGDAVAVVIADTLAQAKDAAEKVVVDYEPLSAVVDPTKAAQKGAPLIHDSAPNNTIYNWHIGDPAATDAAFKNAKHVTKLEFINNRLVPNAMEPRAALAEYDSASGHLTFGTRRKIRTWRGSSLPPSSAWRPSTNCASSRPTSAAALARRFSSIRRRSFVSGRRASSTGR